MKYSRSTTLKRARALPTSNGSQNVIVSYLEAYESVRRALTSLYNKYFLYTLTLPSQENIYHIVHDELLAQVPERRARRFEVSSSFKPTSRDGLAGRREIDFVFSDSQSHKVIIEGRTISVTFEKEEQPNHQGPKSSIDHFVDKKTITFTTNSIAAFRALKNWITQVQADYNSQVHPPRLRTASKWGSWLDQDIAIRRTTDTVILEEGLLEQIVSDIETFLSNRQRYEAIGLPWHRGILLYGPPGTGKTTIPQAIATKFNLDLSYLCLGDMESDVDLTGIISSIRGGVLLIEDIDVNHAATERSDEIGNASLSGLLNALDGVTTPPGLITFLTTNDIDALDSALLRPGRVDRRFHIGYIKAEQVNRLFEMFYGQRMRHPVQDEGLSDKATPAQLLEIFKHHFDEPDIAEDLLHKQLKGNHG